MSAPDEAERFQHDTAQHEMTVLQDDGLHRHLRFKNPEHGFYWFDLVTWPGVLTVNGDMDAFVFARVTDMFTFFRGTRVNPGYWAEKVRSGRDGLRVYSEDVFRRLVTEHFVDAVRYGDAPRGLGKAVRAEILDAPDIYYEDGARAALASFRYKDFYFADTWEWDLADFGYQYLWCCHAIQWGIGQYDRRLVAA